jgi:hypothetical protein
VGIEVRPWVGSYVLLGFGALIFAGGIGARRVVGDMKERSFSWLQPASVLAGIAVCLVSIGGAVWWVWAGAHGPIERTRLNAIPPYVMNAMKSDTRPRLLAIDLSSGSAGYAVLSDDHIRLVTPIGASPSGDRRRRVIRLMILPYAWWLGPRMPTSILSLQRSALAMSG